jgi:hypothetical protein
MHIYFKKVKADGDNKMEDVFTMRGWKKHDRGIMRGV